MIGSAREITTTFGAAQAKDWSYLNLQERLHHKNFFAQIFYDKSNSGNSDSLDANGTYYLRTGIPVVDKSSILATQVQQGLQWSRTKFVVGAEYLATRPQTQGTIDGRNENDDNINEYGGYLQTTTTITPKVDFLAAARVDANSRIDGYQFSPRAALIFRPDSNNNFRVTFNRAYGSPTSFSFFLDQYSGQTPAPGMPVQIFGNPPKTGWQFAEQLRWRVRRTVHAIAVRPLWRSILFGRGVRRQCVRRFRYSLRGLRRRQPAAGHHPGPTVEASLEATRPRPRCSRRCPSFRALRPTDANVGSVLVDLNSNNPLDVSPVRTTRRSARTSPTPGRSATRASSRSA